MYTFQTKLLRGLLLTVLIGLLMACGGGGSSAQTSQSIVAKGVITAKGSIWVNGVEYETPVGGSYSSDDDPNFDPALYKVGQVVSLSGRRNDDGISGTADVVEYEAEIEGEASAGNIINGVSILTDETLDEFTRYEVSGFWVNDTTLQATFFKVDDDSDSFDEVKGRVDVVVDATSITVNGVVYLWANTSDFSEGNMVEVHFIPNIGPPFQATDVQHEDDLLDNPDDGMESEIEGPVNRDGDDILKFCGPLTSSTTIFMIGSKCIDWDFVDRWEDGLIDENDLVSGLRVEAEGHYDAAGVLIAEKIKGRGNQVRISAIVSNVDVTGGTGTMDVFGGAIQVTTQNGLTDIEDLLVDDAGFEIRGIRNGTTLAGTPSVLALRIKSDSVGTNDHELRAEVDDNGVDSSPDVDNTITVMGISSIVNTFTKLKDEDVEIWPGDGGNTDADVNVFLDDIDVDGNITNGPNDVVEVRIDTTNGGNGSSVPYTAKEVEIEREDD